MKIEGKEIGFKDFKLRILGFGVWGLGLALLWTEEFRRFGCRVWGVGFGVWRVRILGVWVQGSGSGVLVFSV